MVINGQLVSFYDGVFSYYQQELDNNVVCSLCIDFNDNIWVGTSNSLYRYNGEEWYMFPDALTDSICSISLLTDNKLIASNFFGEILKYDGSDWEIYEQLPNPYNQVAKQVIPSVNNTLGIVYDNLFISHNLQQT